MEIDGYWYFFKSDGTMLTGWLKQNGNYYYMEPAGSGRMAAGNTVVIDGLSYIFAANGVCANPVNIGEYYDAATAASSTASSSTTPSTSTGSVSGSQTSNSGGSPVITAGGSNHSSYGPGMK